MRKYRKGNKNMNSFYDFANRIKILRIERDMKQQEICKSFSRFAGRKTTLPVSTWSSWEIGDKCPKYETLIQIAEYFDVTVDYLIGRVDEKKGQSNSKKPAGLRDLLIKIDGKELKEYDGKPVLIKYSDGSKDHYEWGIYSKKSDIFRCSEKMMQNSPFYEFYSSPIIFKANSKEL